MATAAAVAAHYQRLQFCRSCATTVPVRIDEGGGEGRQSDRESNLWKDKGGGEKKKQSQRDPPGPYLNESRSLLPFVVEPSPLLT